MSKTGKEKRQFVSRRATKKEIECTNTTLMGSIPKDTYMYPFVSMYPSVHKKRRVIITITQYSGFPHYWVRIQEEENLFLGTTNENGKIQYVWASMGHSHFSQLDLTHGDRLEVYDFIMGKGFTKECNTIEDAESYIEETVKSHFSDESLYDVVHEYPNYTQNYKDGD